MTTKYNGYELNYSLEELKKMTSDEMTDIVLLSPDSPEYQALPAGDQKALQHLVTAAKILNNVTLRQDNPLNLLQKQALEQNAAHDEQAALSLKIFNSLNGVSGLNGVDPDPVCVFKNLTTPAGKNFYPADLSVDEFHQIAFLRDFYNSIICHFSEFSISCKVNKFIGFPATGQGFATFCNSPVMTAWAHAQPKTAGR